MKVDVLSINHGVKRGRGMRVKDLFVHLSGLMVVLCLLQSQGIFAKI